MKTPLILLFILFSSLIMSQKPNIIYILADDMGYGDVAILNEQCRFPTPNIDQLAREGMRFTDAHTNSSCCTPTRYGIMTGRYAWRTPLKSGVLSGYSPLMIEDDRITIASFLKEQGYTTACIGKWHMGLDWPSFDAKDINRSKGINVDYTSEILRGPLDVGFDYFYGLAGSLGMPPHAYIENRYIVGELGPVLEGKSKKKGEPFYHCRPGQSTKGFNVYEVLNNITERSIAYIEDKADKKQPFFLYFSLNSPHAPVAPNSNWDGASGINPYADFVMETDWSVGQIMKVLKEKGIANNTLIIFTADNGCSQTAGFKVLAATGHRPGYIYRGLKGTLYEAGHRVAHIARWPQKVKAGSISDALVCTTDFLATMAELFNKPLSDNEGEDSQSFFQALVSEQQATFQRERVVHHSSDGHFAIRKGNWKLIIHEGNGLKHPKTTGDLPEVVNPANIQLFDLDIDPGELVNVQAAHPAIVEELKKLLIDDIQSGRSTPGIPQENEPGKKAWKQIDWIITEI